MTATHYKSLREALGLTQSELAAKLDVSKRTIIYREQGRKIPREAESAILALARAAKIQPPKP